MAKQQRTELLLSIIIIIITAILMFAYYNRWFSLAYTVGPFRAIHYLAFAGTLYIAFSVPITAYLKRRRPQKYQTLTRIHMFMNLVAFLLISLHFAGQLGRPADFYPELGTGLALYIAMVLQVFTGLAFRLNQKRFVKPITTRFLHVGLALVFYIVIVTHILHGLGII